jgi:hypothetical protein
MTKERKIKSVHYSVQKLLSQIQYTKAQTHETNILPAVLYGFETWSLTLNEVYNLKIK